MVNSFKDFDWDEIQAFYDEGHLLKDVYERFGCKGDMVRKAMKMGLFVKDEKKNRKQYLNHDWKKIQEYYDNGASLDNVCKKFGFSIRIINSANKVGMFNKRSIVTSKDRPKQYSWNKIQEYYDEGNSVNDIYKKFNITRTTLDKARDEGLFKFDPTKRYGHKKVSIPVSEETKKKLSIALKKYHKNNPGQSHWAKHDAYISEPCEKIKRLMREHDIDFIAEYQPLDDRCYSGDIVLHKLGVILEINGTQHYERTGKLKPYYQERHDLITEAGWHVIEIFYNLAYNEEFCEMLIKDIKSGKIVNYKNHVFGFKNRKMEDLISDAKRLPKVMKLIKKEKKQTYILCQKCKVNQKYITASVCYKCHCKSNRTVGRPPYNVLIKEIEETSYVQVGKKYGVTDNAIRKWVQWYEKHEGCGKD